MNELVQQLLSTNEIKNIEIDQLKNDIKNIGKKTEQFVHEIINKNEENNENFKDEIGKKRNFNNFNLNHNNDEIEKNQLNLLNLKNVDLSKFIVKHNANPNDSSSIIKSLNEMINKLKIIKTNVDFLLNTNETRKSMKSNINKCIILLFSIVTNFT